jgi:hypothetical protein
MTWQNIIVAGMLLMMFVIRFTDGIFNALTRKPPKDKADPDALLKYRVSHTIITVLWNVSWFAGLAWVLHSGGFW